MVLLKINNPAENLIIINKVFQASEIVPLAIQLNDNNNNTFKVLFKLNEHITNTDIFFEINLFAENDLDASYIKSKSIYIDNLTRDENKYNAFKNIMKDFSEDKFYVGDFSYNLNDGNYYITGFKQLVGDDNRLFFEKMKIYIPRYMIISTSMYLQSLLDPYNNIEKEYLLISNEIATMKFEKAQNLKLIGTCKTKKDNYFSYNTMYQVSNGPTKWNFTYDVYTEEDLELKEPIEQDSFNTWFSQYNSNFIGVVLDPNKSFYYIITKNDQEKVVAITVSKELMDKSNLLNPYNIFVENKK